MAIAFDTRAAATSVSSSLDYSHTCTGSNVTLVLYVRDNGTNDYISVTYNGVSMGTQVFYVSDAGGGGMAGWVLSGAATGANTIHIEKSTGTFQATSTSYSGASTLDASNSKSNTASGNDAATVTVVTANSWVIAAVRAETADAAGTWNSTLRSADISGPNPVVADSNGPLAAGSQDVGFNWSVSDTHLIAAMAIKPFTAAVGATPQIPTLLLMGV